MNRKAFTIVELLVVVTIIGIIFALLVGGCSAVISCGTSEGHRDGYIQKVSKRNGFFVSSYEVDMALPGFGGSQSDKVGQNNGNVWSFSIDNEDVWNQANDVTAEQLVRVYYEESRWQWSHYTNYIATKIEVVTPVKRMKIED